jgi:hypothetical protein
MSGTQHQPATSVGSSATGAMAKPEPTSILDEALAEWIDADLVKDRKIERLEQELAELRYLAAQLAACKILGDYQGTRH